MVEDRFTLYGVVSVICLIVVAPARVRSVSLIPTADQARDFKLFGRCARWITRSRVQSVQSRPLDRLTRRGKREKTKRIKCTYIFTRLNAFLPLLSSTNAMTTTCNIYTLYILYYMVIAMSGFVRLSLRDNERYVSWTASITFFVSFFFFFIKF